METPADTFHLNHASIDVRSLQEELELLTSDLTEANEQRAQAAEYGLVLLQEKQALQSKHEELSGLYDCTKRELDNSVNALKQVQADYEKRLKDVEAQREQLLEEMETRENALINEVDRGEEKMRQLERKLKQAATEIDCVNDQNSYLAKELDKSKKEVENFKEDNRSLKQNNVLLGRETEDLSRETQRLEQRIDLLTKLDDECHKLQEENSTLMKDSRTLQEQLETITVEKEDLEYRTEEAMQALNDERESRSLLEMKLGEDSRVSPMRWAEERETGGDSTRDEVAGLGGSISAKDEAVRTTPSPLSRGEGFAANLHSTPYPSKIPPPSLLSEIEDSFAAEADKEEELKRLRGRVSEMEGIVGSNKNEKRVLEENLAAYSVRETSQIKELEGFKERFAKEMCEKDKKIEDLNQRILIRDEQTEQFRSKLSTTTAERTSMQIEVDGLNGEIQRVKVVSGLEIDKYQRESAQEQTRNVKLSSQIAVLEEQVSAHANNVKTLEDIVCNSQTELASMTDDVSSMQKVVTSLVVDGNSPSPTTTTNTTKPGQVRGTEATAVNGVTGKEPLLTNGGAEERGESMISEGYYSLKIGARKLPVQVHGESNSLRAITSLREQLKLVRSPLEQFTKLMLERSLVYSTKHAPPPSSSSPDPTGANRKNTLDLEAMISKLKSKLMHRMEEANNLRSIMKARDTTAQVATSSLRSKLDGQARAYQTELTKLRYQIKILKKEKGEHLSLRTMYAKRCDDYIDEITRVKKEAEKLQQEFDGLYVSLEKTIKRKLELSTELEEYKMEQERRVLIPKLLESSRV